MRLSIPGSLLLLSLMVGCASSNPAPSDKPGPADDTVPDASGVSDVMPSDAAAVPPEGGSVDGDIDPDAVAVAGSAVIATPLSGIPVSAARRGGSIVSGTTSAYAPAVEIEKLAAPLVIDIVGDTTTHE